MAHLYGPGGMKNPSAELWHRVWLTYTDPRDEKTRPLSCGTEYGSLIRTRRDEKPVRRVVAPTGSGNEFAAEDEGDFDAVEAAESASAAIQSPFASLERLVPRDGVQFLEAIWKKYGNFISNFKLGNFVGGAMLTLLCCTNEEHQPLRIKRIGVGVTAEVAYGVVAGAVDDVVVKVVDAVILEIIENASNLQEIPAVGNSPQDRDCDLGRCETADFYELLLALMGVHHSFIVASANIVMIGKECMNVVGTIELIAGAIAEQTYEVWCCSRTSYSRFMILEGDDLAFVVL
uniref:Uncharacterized protein n=1 Tax=Fagus sylvatica TaxID=28930 RepID=A0A2N9G0R1_FAGSY